MRDRGKVIYKHERRSMYSTSRRQIRFHEPWKERRPRLLAHKTDGCSKKGQGIWDDALLPM